MGQRIDVNHENIYYGDFLAVEDVNINIEPNKVTAFIGPSGCGKSTVLRTLDRMHEIIPGAHVEGEVLLEGKNLYDKDVDPVAVRRDVGMVFQRPNPFPTMSIRENVLAGVRLNNHHLAKSDADDLVEWALRGATSGKRSRTVLTTLASACPVASSSVCASPAPWPSTRRCCSWMSPAPPWTRFRPWLSRI